MTNLKNFNWNKYIKEALDRTEFMAISTIGDDGSWICPVQFSNDERINLYFKSMPNSRHMQNIKKNNKISVAIFSTNRLPNGDVIGIQLKGRAIILDSYEEVEIAAKHHYSREDSSIDYKSRIDKHLGEDAKWNFVKVIPGEAWYFDTRFFDEEKQGRQKIPLDSLKLKI